MLSAKKTSRMVFVLLAMILLVAIPVVTGAAGENGIVSPEDGATISGSVEVTGVAVDPNFEKWQLDILGGGDESNASFIALGEEQVLEAATLATVDTTMYPDGEYTLRLRVVRTDGQYDEYFTAVTIANDDAPAAAPAPEEADTTDEDAAETDTADTTDEDAAATDTADTADEDAATTEDESEVEAAAPESVNGITSPEDSATVSGSVDVEGVAVDPNFEKWQLDILGGGAEDNASFIALGEEQVSEAATLATVDTTMYPDGDYTLRLRVVRTDGQYDEYFTAVTIANDDAPAAAPVPADAEEADMVDEADEADVADEDADMADMADEDADEADMADEDVDEAAAPESANGITSPEDAATISGSVEVMGVAMDSNFAKWQLDILGDGAESNASFIALGEEQVTEEATLATVDTTMYPDGDYTLRLRVVRNDGQYDEYFSTVTIANN